MYLTLFVGVLCWSLFWYAYLYVRSSFAIILTRKRELGALFFIIFQDVLLLYMPFGSSSRVMGWLAACDCVISIILTYFLTSTLISLCNVLLYQNTTKPRKDNIC